MKHVVAISLVFFSLTHLAKAEDVGRLKLLTERYCNKTQIDSQVISSDTDQLNDQRNPFFLTYSELTLIGILPEVKVSKHMAHNHIVADLTIRKKPKNNSP
ncbi:hypothetical protein FA048_01290 [Pedobacter polaris]|uniref:Uncharacterized protein n=1 Tax=Pedobacter polaris TaxID=2571273 RepID=A0A4U1CU01_9SPHI|nr:hypothetical protein [Pedobacter polaris]TKC12283.1 hypothetical protein FA048_01290 [Pedobacter polaris]